MPPEGKLTPLEVRPPAPPKGFIGRIATGIRYAIRGVAPDDWFGPLQPLEPTSPVLSEPRRFDYRSGLNIQYQPRGEEGVSFPQMRTLADSYDVLRLVIETRKDQVERLRWNIRPKVAAGKRTPNAVADPRIAALEGFFRKPDGVHRWGTWLRMLLEDLFVIDAPALYKARAVGGALLALEPVDGATIKVLIDDQGRTPPPPDPAYQQVLHGVPKADFSRDELIYLPRNPRTAKIYGFSPVEQIITTVNIALRRQLAQMQYFTEGNMPEALIGVPQNWTMEQIGQFQEYWDTILAGNTAERRHAKFVPADFKYQPMRDPPLKDEFDEWLARIVCYAFSTSPAPFTRQMNRATADNAQEMALAEGLGPIMLWIKCLVDQVIEEDFGSPDLEFEWIDEKSEDPMRQAQITDMKLRMGLKTINEARAEAGEDPVEGGDTPLIFTGSGAVTLASVLNGAPAEPNSPIGASDPLQNIPENAQ
jgi:PAS domain-containing protein